MVMARILRTGYGSGSAFDESTAAARTMAAARQIMNSLTLTSIRREPYQLLTHCGIDWAQIDGRWWRAETPLSDGSGNPPPGWDGPYQHGELVFRDASTVVFESRAGNVTLHPTDQTPPGCD